MLREITVCSACKRASCFYGIFYCEEARTAGLIRMAVSELRKLKLEHSSYWSKETVERHTVGSKRARLPCLTRRGDERL